LSHTIIVNRQFLLGLESGIKCGIGIETERVVDCATKVINDMQRGGDLLDVIKGKQTYETGVII
jgi:hypothetical protein